MLDLWYWTIHFQFKLHKSASHFHPHFLFLYRSVVINVLAMAQYRGKPWMHFEALYRGQYKGKTRMKLCTCCSPVLASRADSSCKHYSSSTALAHLQMHAWCLITWTFSCGILESILYVPLCCIQLFYCKTILKYTAVNCCCYLICLQVSSYTTSHSWKSVHKLKCQRIILENIAMSFNWNLLDNRLNRM